VAVAQGSQSIGFAIPAEAVKPVVESVKEYGRIVRPQLGVRYVALTLKIAGQNGLSVTEGALVLGNNGEPGVIPGSPAAEAGLAEGDIIVQVNGVNVTREQTLGSIILKHKVGNELVLQILRNDEEKIIIATLREWER
jgi:serine protease Do